MKETDTTTIQWRERYDVLYHKQTYLNLIYLFLAFPLGVSYFVFSVTGLSLGVGLLIIWVGLFILAALFASWRGLAEIERQLAIHLLGEEIAPLPNPFATEGTTWERAKAYFTNSRTWKSVLYIVMKFPLGIAAFVMTVTAVSICGSLVFAPFIYRTADIYIFGWSIDTLFEALIATGLGLFITPFVFQFLNKAAQLLGQFAGFMLGDGNRVQNEKSPEDMMKVVVE